MRGAKDGGVERRDALGIGVRVAKEPERAERLFGRNAEEPLGLAVQILELEPHRVETKNDERSVVEEGAVLRVELANPEQVRRDLPLARQDAGEIAKERMGANQRIVRDLGHGRRHRQRSLLPVVGERLQGHPPAGAHRPAVGGVGARVEDVADPHPDELALGPSRERARGGVGVGDPAAPIPGEHRVARGVEVRSSQSRRSRAVVVQALEKLIPTTSAISWSSSRSARRAAPTSLNAKVISASTARSGAAERHGKIANER